jgi:hypothetical protein
MTCHFFRSITSFVFTRETLSTSPKEWRVRWLLVVVTASGEIQGRTLPGAYLMGGPALFAWLGI